MRNNKIISVYGSLLVGLGNHGVIRGRCELLGKTTVKIPYKMRSLGGFPALTPSVEINEVEVEVFKVNDTTYESVERLEGFPHFYQKFAVDTEFGASEVYVINDGYDNAPEVPKTKGVYEWRTFLENRNA